MKRLPEWIRLPAASAPDLPIIGYINSNLLGCLVLHMEDALTALSP
jgi:hypothetical protein